MKKGAASRGKEFAALVIRCGRVRRFSPEVKMCRREAIPKLT
jgi:hypothetical protein